MYEQQQQQPAYIHQSTYDYQPTHGPPNAYEPQYKPNDNQLASTRISNPAPPTSRFRPTRLTARASLTRASLTQPPRTPATPVQAPVTEASPIQIPRAYVPPTDQAPPVHAPVTEALQAQTSPIPASPAKVPPAQALRVEVTVLPIQAPLAQVLPAPVSPIQASTAQLLPALASLPASTLQAYTSGLVNHLLNYEAVHKPMQQSYLNENVDDEFYFTDCQYQKGKFKRQDLCYHRKKRMKQIEMDEAG